MKPKKATSYEEYKAREDARRDARREADRRFPGLPHFGIAVPSTPTALLQQFFELRHENVPLQTIVTALRKAYEVTIEVKSAT